MRHRKSGRKLGVTTKHRKAMFRNMATDLLREGKINTTDTRAKEIRRVVEKLITLGKNGSLHARRKALGYVRDRVVVEKLFSELAQRYMERPGGYTRIVKLGYRRGDNAPLSLIELVTEEFRAKKKKKQSAATATASDKKAEKAKSSKKKSAEELGLVEKEQASDATSKTDVEEKEPESAETASVAKEQAASSESPEEVVPESVEGAASESSETVETEPVKDDSGVEESSGSSEEPEEKE